jgi:hypothetical protein
MLALRASAVIILGSLSVLPACAQMENCQHRTVTVSVSTTDGSPAPPLESVNFAGVYRNKPIQVTTATLNREPTRVVLLLDVSGSMEGAGPGFEGRFSLDVAENFVNNLLPETEIGLGFFYSKLIPISLPTKDRKSLMFQLEALRSHPESYKGRTALWDAVLGSAKMFDHPRLGDAIYVITDGGDNASKNSLNHVVQTLRESGIRLSGLVYQAPSALRRSEEEVIGPPNVDRVVRETGGTILTQLTRTVGSMQISGEATLVDKSGKPTLLASYLGSQYRQLTSFYRISFNLPEALHKPQGWKLELAGLEKSQRGKFSLAYPQMLAACQ